MKRTLRLLTALLATLLPGALAAQEEPLRTDSATAAAGSEPRTDPRVSAAPADTPIVSGWSDRDWGGEWSWFVPTLGWKAGVGPVVGGGPRWTEYAFRTQPYARRHWLRFKIAPLEYERVAVQYLGDFRFPSSRRSVSVLAEATRLERLRFYGFGNRTGDPLDPDAYDVWLNQVQFLPALTFPLGESGSVAVGPVAKWTEPAEDAAPGSPLARTTPTGFRDGFGQLGVIFTAELDRRDDPAFPRSGVVVEAEGSAYPAAWDVPEPFAKARLAASTYLAPSGVGPVLALRAGGAQLWGDFPVYESAFLGGRSTLRGFPGDRFAGDAMVFGSAELRTRVLPFKLLVRGDLGILALADAGRVWFEGESEGEWHTALGGGLFVTAIGRSAYIAYAHGERSSVYLGLGMPF